MTSYYAELDGSGAVTRVIVCDALQWITDRLGGLWSETKIADPIEKYAGMGHHHAAFVADQFLADWNQPASPAEGYAKVQWSWHNGRAWRSNHANNTSVPGAANWREYLDEWPQWNNGGEPWQIGDKCTQATKHWINTVDDNTKPPQSGNSGWVEVPIETVAQGKGKKP
jgi:hypothetical protein